MALNFSCCQIDMIYKHWHFMLGCLWHTWWVHWLPALLPLHRLLALGSHLGLLSKGHPSRLLFIATGVCSHPELVVSWKGLLFAKVWCGITPN